MPGEASPGEHPGIIQNGRGGADCRQPVLRGMLAQHDRSHTRVVAEVFYPRPTRQEDAIEIARGRRDRGQRRVGVQRDSAPAGHVNAVAERCGCDFRARAPQEVDRRDRLNFLKTSRQDCENRGHHVS